MVNFWDAVNRVIREADILLLIMDSRLSLETRNEEVENKIIRTGKPYLFVLTKCDLIDQDTSERLKKIIKPSLFVSATEYHGLKMLREKIIVLGKKHYPENKKYTVGVLGYPNVGKSSLINAMNGRRAAGVSSTSGFTKGVQKIKSDNTILFLDTPGVVPYSEKNDEKHAMIGTTDYNKVKEPDLSVLNIMDAFPGKIEAFYEVPVEIDGEEKISMIAIKRNIIKRGGIPDIDRMSRKILKDWQEGTIK